MAGIARLLAVLTVGAACVAPLAACSSDSEESAGPTLPALSDLNPFANGKTLLTGKRVAVLTSEDQINGHMEASASALALPPPVQSAEWATPGGAAGNAPGHLALGGSMRTIWSASAGIGSSAAAKLTAPPIVTGGRVYVFDANSHVTAFSASGGERLWSVKASPETENETKTFGGGIAAGGGHIVAVTGFGTAVGLDAGSGAKAWEQKLGAPFHNAPTISDGRMFAANIDGVVYCLSVTDGKVLWSYHGSPQQSAALLTSARPAVSGDIVVVPFSTGDIVALKLDTGTPVWTESLNGARASSSIASLSDPSSPVADGGSVYAVSRSGRMISSSAESGTRTWSMNLNGVETPWVVGDVIYVVDLTGRLVALNRVNGEVRWAAKLPGNAKVWNGPVLAGGKLWVTSSKGLLAAIDPVTGQVSGQRELGSPVYIAPIVADNRMFVLTDHASLMALE